MNHEFRHESDRDLLIEVATIVRKMDERLFGNGQPGEIDKMNKEIRSLTSYRNRIVGAVGTVTFLLLAFGAVLLEHILTGTSSK